MKKYWVILKENFVVFILSLIGREKRTIGELDENIRQLETKLKTANANVGYYRSEKSQEENRRKEFASELNRVCNELEEAKKLITNLEGDFGKQRDEILRLKQRASAYKSLYQRKKKNEKNGDVES